MILSLIAVAGIAAACGQQRGAGRQAAGDGGPVFLDETRTIEERVEDALARMTTEEKVAVLHAQSKFSSAGVPRLGILRSGLPTALTESVRRCFGTNGVRPGGQVIPARRSRR